MIWLEMLGVGAGWALVIVTLVIHLDNKRRDELKVITANSERSYTELRTQISDIDTSFSSNYVMRRETDAEFRNLAAVLREIKEDVSAVHKRVDDVFRNVSWRGHDDG